MQSKDLSAAGVMSADGLQEDGARSHPNADDANLSRDWRFIVSLKRHRDRVTSSVKTPDRRISVTAN
jgi:hypothetical protein